MQLNPNYFNWEGFKIIPPPATYTTFSEIKITGKSLVFSKITVSELDYAEHVMFLFSNEEQKLIVAPSVEQPFTCKFFDESMGDKGVTILYEELTRVIRTTMKWPTSKGTYRVPGIRIPNKDNNIFLCFDLTKAETGRKKQAKFDAQRFLSACPSVNELMGPRSSFKTFGLPAHQDTAKIEILDPNPQKSDKIIEL